MMKKYPIRTLADIYNTVPSDKIKDCMDEIAEAMTSASCFCALARLANPELEDSLNTEIGPWPEEIVWIDSGLGVVTFSAVSESGEALIIESKMKPPKAKKTKGGNANERPRENSRARG